ncbi:MAG TPA: hypothetical protein VGE31_01435 [Candidatus Paceibacterota bacterium]
MPPPIVWIFVIIGSTFASVHNFAVAASLYWYYPWFDIVMHFWGGFLVALGVQAFCGFRFIPIRPTLAVTLTVLFVTMIAWEFFERIVGLYSPATYLFDTAKDIAMGLAGGLIGYAFLRRYK